MRKRTISPNAGGTHASEWLDLDQLATVEVSSEQPDFPAEAVFSEAVSGGWKAAEEGEQTLRLVFDDPHDIGSIHLVFREEEQERTNEFALSYALASGEQREIVRQQWTFGPGGSTEEIEDYQVGLRGVSSLMLRIRPGRGRATLAHWLVR